VAPPRLGAGDLFIELVYTVYDSFCRSPGHVMYTQYTTEKLNHTHAILVLEDNTGVRPSSEPGVLPHVAGNGHVA
jgi:hypothetical protein